MRTFFHYFITLFLPLHLISAPTPWGKQADRLFTEGNFDDAAHLYMLLNDPDMSDRLAAALLETGKASETIALLQVHPIPYFQSIAYRRLGFLHQAAEVHAQANLPDSDEIFLERGKVMELLGANSEAEQAFVKVRWNPEQPLLYCLARLNLARLQLNRGDLEEAHALLEELKEKIPANHPLRYERSYLLGREALLQENYALSATFFQQAMPQLCEQRPAWCTAMLKQLARSYLLAAENTKDGQRQKLLDLAKEALSQRDAILTDDESYLLQADLALLSLPQDKWAIHQLLQDSNFTTQEGKAKAKMKLVRLSESVTERETTLNELISTSNIPQQLLGKAWFWKGKLAYDQKKFADAEDAFAQAATCFGGLSDSALRGQVLACIQQHGEINLIRAWSLLQGPHLELRSAIFARFDQAPPTITQEAAALFQRYPTDPHALKGLALLAAKQEEWQQAATIYLSLQKLHPKHTLLVETCWLISQQAFKKGNDAEARQWLLHLYVINPRTPLHPLASFQLYSFGEYVTGQRKALKHLQNFVSVYPEHPLSMIGYYLIGLDNKKERYSDHEKLIHRRDWIAAIDAFQQAETIYIQLISQNTLPEEDYPYYQSLYERLRLERALANLKIAEESKGSKRAIYLEYAQEVLEEMHQPNVSPYSKFHQEGDYWLAYIYHLRGDDAKALAQFGQNTARFSQEQINFNLMLSKSWEEVGKIEVKQARFSDALQSFLKAENAAKGGLYLTPDEKLSLWIEQSLCYKYMGQWDESMRLLSKVVNEEVISPLRIQAMLLRADLYELQGKQELALKQLEAVKSKGGVWGATAKQRLKEKYGYE